jgi:hypothetical protein
MISHRGGQAPLGIGASSPKMRIEKRKSAASVSSCLDGGRLGLFSERGCVV